MKGCEVRNDFLFHLIYSGKCDIRGQAIELAYSRSAYSGGGQGIFQARWRGGGKAFFKVVGGGAKNFFKPTFCTNAKMNARLGP